MKALNSLSNDDAIGNAISSTAFIIRLMKNGDQVIVEENMTAENRCLLGNLTVNPR